MSRAKQSPDNCSDFIFTVFASVIRLGEPDCLFVLNKIPPQRRRVARPLTFDGERLAHGSVATDSLVKWAGTQEKLIGYVLDPIRASEFDRRGWILNCFSENDIPAAFSEARRMMNWGEIYETVSRDINPEGFHIRARARALISIILHRKKARASARRVAARSARGGLRTNYAI